MNQILFDVLTEELRDVHLPHGSLTLLSFDLGPSPGLICGVCGHTRERGEK
jgi:hypothetical protein